MPVCKLTKSTIDRLGSQANEVFYWDTQIRGFGVKILPSGRKVFILQKDVGGRAGRTRRYTIGTYGDLTLYQARGIATELAHEVRRGKDPVDERRKALRGTLRAAYDLYAEKRLVQLRSGTEVGRTLERNFIKPFGDRALSDIKRSDVKKRIEILRSDGKAIAANRLLAFIKKFLNWCVEEELLDANPVSSLRIDRTVEVERDRVLSATEIRDVWQALNEIKSPVSDALKMLLLTAQRREEVAKMQWEDIDFHSNLWKIPAWRAKNGRSHEIPLSTVALEIIKSQPDIGDYIFSFGGDKPVSNWSHQKRRLDEKISEIRQCRGEEVKSIKHWRIHDLRRTAATNIARTTAPHIVSRLLNHAEGGVTKIYNRYSFLKEKKEALDGWSKFLLGIVGDLE